MPSDGQVIFEISADGKKAKASINDITRAIDDAGKQWDKSVSESTKNMENAFAKALDVNRLKDWGIQAAKALIDFGKGAVDAASDLREVQNVVDVTFGDGAAQIEAWAKTAQSQFGLTETQAKQFTSTLGAMMKSSGIAGDEIIGMSTDLAGLAADMASFYNLDFETAFQKIRSGISGETEPLKQLGINMSVANLEAYALTQGITKSFDKMSQGEQTMLRYQYLMQATADAQGDFARTSDGFANAQRRVQTAVESIKTSVGTMLLDVVEPLTSGMAGFLEKLTATPERTIIDEFNDIDEDTASKLANITKTAEDARELVSVLQNIQGEKIENASLTSFVSSLSGQLGDLDKAMIAAKNGNYAGTISGIADAMATKTGTDAQQWETLLTTISGKLPEAAAAVGENGDTTEAFLSAAAAAAAELGGDYPALWETFMATLGSDETQRALSYMANGQAAADAMNAIGINAKGLDGSEKDNWSGLLGVLETASPTKGMFGKDAQSAATNIGSLSSALSSNDPAKKKQAWEDMLGVLTNNIGGVAELAKQSPEDTKKWLEGLARSAAEIDPNDPKAWGDLFTALVDGLPGLSETEVGAAFLNNLKTFAENSNTLNSQSAGNWSSLLKALNDADTTKGIFGADAASRITGLSDALANGDPLKKKAAWEEMLGVLSSNADAVSTLTSKSPDELKRWLTELAEAAPETDEDLEQWNVLLTELASAFTGLDKEGLGENFLASLEKLGTDADGNAFFAALSAGFMGLGTQASEAERALMALGVDTSEIDDKQAAWLKTCQKLVETIPGLSEVINTETGEIKGGVQAVLSYIDAWEKGQKRLAYVKAAQKMQEALAQAQVELKDIEIDIKVTSNTKSYKEAKARYDELLAEAARFGATKSNGGWVFKNNTILAEEAARAVDKYAQENASVLGQVDKLTREHEKQAAAVAECQERYDAAVSIVEEYGGSVEDITKGTQAASNATEELTQDEKALKAALTSTAKALEEVEKYYDSTYQKIEGALEGSHELFGLVNDPADEATKKIKEVEDAIAELDKKKDASKRNKLEVELTGLKEAQKTINNMNAGLQSQISYYQKYSEMLAKARELGYSDEVISSVSDGSQESYAYLQAMTNSGVTKDDARVKQLNDSFKKAAEERAKLTKELTEQSLSTDEAFKSLVQSATDAVNGLNLGDQAKTAMENTVQGLIDGMAAKHKDLQTEVDRINATLSRMGGFGLGFGLGNGGFSLSFGSKGENPVDGSHALGLDYVPFNNYLAQLHEGEGILTAEENKVWQQFKNGGLASRNVVDYDALGATMRENVHAGGNVYLDGQTVGRVISAAQANSYRAMERSGFQQ